MTDRPKRPWWRKKRWLAAGLLWLAVAYPLSQGPAVYSVMRGWLPRAWFDAAYAPLSPEFPPRSRTAYGRYLTGWFMTAVRHRRESPREIILVP